MCHDMAMNCPFCGHIGEVRQCPPQEVPSFKKGAINIGDRQRGRLQATSIINCKPTKKSIANAMNILYSPIFQVELSQVCNPYGEGGASEKVVNTLKSINIKNVVKKAFHDLPNSALGVK